MVLPEGFEPSIIDPKSIVISISPWEQNDNFFMGIIEPQNMCSEDHCVIHYTMRANIKFIMRFYTYKSILISNTLYRWFVCVTLLLLSMPHIFFCWQAYFTSPFYEYVYQELLYIWLNKKSNILIIFYLIIFWLLIYLIFV